MAAHSVASGAGLLEDRERPVALELRRKRGRHGRDGRVEGKGSEGREVMMVDGSKEPKLRRALKKAARQDSGPGPRGRTATGRS